jgi:hypothetical protein
MPLNTSRRRPKIRHNFQTAAAMNLFMFNNLKPRPNTISGGFRNRWAYASLTKSGGHFEAFPQTIIVDFRVTHPSLCCKYGPRLDEPGS